MAKRQISEIRAKANEIREILESGVKSITDDGTTTVLDLDELRRQLKHLESQLPEFRNLRPRASTYRLDG